MKTRKVIVLSLFGVLLSGCGPVEDVRELLARINELESINQTLSGELAQVQQENQALKSEIEELREKDRENLNRLFR